MMIWAFFKNGTPQHIGNAKDADRTNDLLAGARAARFTTIKFCCRAIKGNEVMVYMFDDKAHMDGFIAHNNNIRFSEMAAA